MYLRLRLVFLELTYGVLNNDDDGGGGGGDDDDDAECGETAFGHFRFSNSTGQ